MDEPATNENAAVPLEPNSVVADVSFRKGLEAQTQGRLDDAIGHYVAALGTGYLNPDLLNNLGGALRDRGYLEKAVKVLNQCAYLFPDYPMCWSNMGNCLTDMGRYDEAADLCAKAAQALPDSVAAQYNLGCVLQAMERDHDAILYFRRTVALDPSHIQAHYNLAESLLRSGQYAEGWLEFEWRQHIPKFKQSWDAVARPFWRGEALNGRSLLINAEQGFGDMIQFSRYLPLIAAQDGPVTFRVYPPLVRLMRQSLGDRAKVVSTADPKPDAQLELMLMSAPMVLAQAAPSLPTPYLSAPPDETAMWHSRLAHLPGLRVGLAWAGGWRPDDPEAMRLDSKRSLPTPMLTALAGIPGISWVSLQKGLPDDQMALIPPGLDLYDAMAQADDFAATAALIQNLDLVITVDTAVAHLAGALGKPVWILSRFHGCWRWLVGRSWSPWYPGATIYQQTARDDWHLVLARIGDDLRHLAANTVP